MTQMLIAEVPSTVVSRSPGPVELDRSKYARRQGIINNILRWGTPVVLLAVWQALSVGGALDRQFWPAPTDVASELWGTTIDGYLPSNLWSTIERLVVGYVAGSLIGVLLGLLLGTVRPLRVALEPIISAFYTVPKLAIFPLLLLLFGVGDVPKIILTALAAFFLTCISTIAAVVSVPAAMYEPMRSFGGTRLQTFWHLTFPAVLSEVFVALRLGSGMAVLVLVGMEMIQGDSGLGHVIWSSWQIFDTQRMYVGIVVAALFGVAFQSTIRGIGRLVMPWERRSGSGR